MKIRFDTRSQSDPTRVGGMTVPYAPAKRTFARWRWYLVLTLAASPLLLFLAKSLFDAAVVEAPAVVSLSQVAVNAPVPGIVSRLSLHPGDKVKAGDPVATLTDPRHEERKSVAENELGSIRKAAAPQDDSAVRLAQRVERRLAAQVATLRRLMAQGAATRAEVDDAEARHDAALRDLDMARKAVAPAELTPEARARVTFLESELQNIRIAEQRLAVTAPVSGTVLEVLAAQGESMAQGAPLVVIAAEGPAHVTAYLSPADIRRVNIGAKTRGRFADGTTVPLTVVSTAGMTQRMPGPLSSSFSSAAQVVPVMLMPESPLPPSVLRQGMPCTVYFGVRSPL